VLRLEDCLLSEQPGILKEFFGGRSGYLPEGSALFFGLLSHLAMRGLENYAEDVVKIFKVFSNMLKSGCSVAHTVHVPLGGVRSDGLIRDMYNLDSWLRSGIFNTQLSLPASREFFWGLAGRLCDEKSVSNILERLLYMPESSCSSNKIRIVSGSAENLLPEIIVPFPEDAEKDLIRCMMREISENYAIEVDQDPVLSQCSGDHVFEKKLR
jgi:hypothetical protein